MSSTWEMTEKGLNRSVAMKYGHIHVSENESKMNKQELLRYVGDQSQIFGIKEYILSGGKASGMKAFDISNGTGLEFTVIADRCLDIGRLAFKGVNCSYLGKTGFVSPVYFDGREHAFFRNFYAGFLTTCGLRNVGEPSTDNGEFFGLHGCISNTPGEEVCASTVWEDELPVMTVSGQMREARFFGENLLLKRKITCRYGENRIIISDSVQNLGFRDELLMLLYHFNMGYPLLDEDAILLLPSRSVVPFDSEASKGCQSWQQMQKPTHGYVEQVFYHDLKTDADGNTCVAMVNRRMELGMAFHYNKKRLGNLTQWKQMGEGEYALGIEPCNCYVGGRLDPLNKEVLKYLKPGEIKNFYVEVEIVTGSNDIHALEEQIKSYKY